MRAEGKPPIADAEDGWLAYDTWLVETASIAITATAPAPAPQSALALSMARPQSSGQGMSIAAWLAPCHTARSLEDARSLPKLDPVP